MCVFVCVFVCVCVCVQVAVQRSCSAGAPRDVWRSPRTNRPLSLLWQGKLNAVLATDGGLASETSPRMTHTQP